MMRTLQKHLSGKKGFLILGVILCLVSLAGCGKSEEAVSSGNSRDISSELTYESSMELQYADQFSVDYYQGGYALISLSEGSRFLLVPEGMSVPEDLAEDVIVLKGPLQNIYLVATAVMDMFVSLDALDSLRFSGTNAEGWYIPQAREAMESGDILYAGKYSAPDYERILSENCGLAIENTMIYHTPEVKEKLEQFGIPVLVDYSSYELSPLGRTEWVKLYGLLVGKEAEAEQAFREQADAFEAIRSDAVNGGTVAFFYITSNGEVNVRKSSDYLPKMIEMAGGSYIFQDLGEEDSAASTISMQMEEFYAAAKDADYIIYNSTIEGELKSLSELTAKNPLLANFKAVQEGKVYGTAKNLYQSSMELGTIIADIHQMLSGQPDGMTYLYELE